MLIVDWRPLSSSLDFVFFSFFANLAREPYSRLKSYCLREFLVEVFESRLEESTIYPACRHILPIVNIKLNCGLYH
eukprot:scaffold128071_cov35-Attheya_sp.AAC.2